ncbi:MAG: GntR family transcriptional regulator [Gemmataceae bacterium]
MTVFAADDLPRLDRPQDLKTQVEQVLREAILKRQFPGDRLPTEVELAEQLGVSRETVRRAAETLQREGLLIKYRRRGTFTRVPTHLEHPLAPPSTLIGYLQADYVVAEGEEAATRSVSGLMLQGTLDEVGHSGFEAVVRRAPHIQLGKVFQRLTEQVRLRGAIFASFGEEKILRRAAGLGIPLVLLDHDLHLPQINSVREDSFGGARLAVRHLADWGHRRIAFANWHRTELNPWRLMGYRQGLRDACRTRRRSWELEAELTESGARQIVASLLALHPMPTALLCFNNTLARLVIDELRRQGQRVPEDISVMGGGGEEMPGLTCHQADWYQIGRLAAQILLRAIADPDHAPEHLLVPHTLRQGATTAKPMAET